MGVDQAVEVGRELRPLGGDERAHLLVLARRLDVIAAEVLAGVVGRSGNATCRKNQSPKPPLCASIEFHDVGVGTDAEIAAEILIEIVHGTS